MVKAFITTIVGIAIIIGASIFENAYIEKTFSNFNSFSWLKRHFIRAIAAFFVAF